MTRARAARAPRTTRGGVACLDCGTDLRVTREPHKYSLPPKWSITITDAEVRRCPKCGPRPRRRTAIACYRSCDRAAKLAEPLAKECDPSGSHFNLRLAVPVEVVAASAA
jgi:hypothetical protein